MLLLPAGRTPGCLCQAGPPTRASPAGRGAREGVCVCVWRVAEAGVCVQLQVRRALLQAARREAALCRHCRAADCLLAACDLARSCSCWKWSFGCCSGVPAHGGTPQAQAHLVPDLACLLLPDGLTLVGKAAPNLHSTTHHARYRQHNSTSNACRRRSAEGTPTHAGQLLVGVGGCGWVEVAEVA